MSAVDTLRDAIFGNPPVPGFKPSREGVLKAFVEINERLQGVLIGVTAYATVAALPTGVDLPVNGTQARVFDDADPDNNTFWIVRDGAWVIDADLIASVAAIVQPLVDQAEAASESFAGLLAMFTTWQQPDYTIVEGYYDPPTGNLISSGAYQSVELNIPARIKRARFTGLETSPIVAGMTFYDADDVIIGDPNFPGPSSGSTQFTNEEIDIPTGAVKLRSSAFAFGNIMRIEWKDFDEGFAQMVVNVATNAKGWVQQDLTFVDGFYQPSGTFTSSTDWKNTVKAISPGQRVRVRDGVTLGASMAAVVFRDADGLATAAHDIGTGFQESFAYTDYVAPDRTVEVCITTFKGDVGYQNYVKAWFTEELPDLGRVLTDTVRVFNPAKKKKIVWIGTSIPAGGGPGGDYPSMVGDLLDIEVINVAIPGSCVRNGIAQVRTASDTVGYRSMNWGNYRVSLMKTIAEVDFVIANWSTGATLRDQFDFAPSSLDSAEIATLYDSCFENRVAPLFGTGVDAWFIDHMHNEGQAFTCNTGDATFQGYIIGNVLTVSSITTGNLAVGSVITGGETASGVRVGKQLTGTAGGAGTYRVTGDPGQFVAGPQALTATTGVIEIWDGNDLSVIPGFTPGYTDYSPLDPGFAIGALNRLVALIRANEGERVPIAAVDYYEKSISFKKSISAAIRTWCDYSQIPLVQLSDRTGFSQEIVYDESLNPVTIGDYYGGVDPSGNGNQTQPLRMLQMWMPDNLHPHSDTTRRCNNKVASLIAPQIASLIGLG